MRLHLQRVPPAQGLHWLSQSLALFWKRPLGFSALFALFLLAAMFMLAVPYLGGLMMLAAMPLLGLSFMIASRSAVQGGPVQPRHLVEPLMGERVLRQRLLLLCGLYALLTALVLLLGDSVDGGRFERLQLLLATASQDAADQRAIEELLDDPLLRQGLLLRMGLIAAVSVPFWHAPALVWWGGQGVAQALFSSSVACWRTKGAMVVNLVAWVGLIVLVGSGLGLLLSLLGARSLIGVLALPVGLSFSTAFYISLYFMFVQTFTRQTTDEEGAEDETDTTKDDAQP